MKRNPLTLAVKLVLTGALAGSLVACGGGSSSTSTDTVSTTSDGTSVGPVTGFGSVYVNGTRFRTDGSVSSDDGIERETQLEKGMILKVDGNWDDSGEGEARRIDYDDTLRGPLTSASWDEIETIGELVIAGQTVRIDDQTVFKGATPVQLRDAAANWRVRVSGWRLDDGSFRASFVGARAIGTDFDDDNDVEIEGVVADLDDVAQTFTINGYPVDYNSAVFDDDLDESELANGLAVEVEGYIDNGTLIAREIDDEDDLFDDDDDVEISGAIAGSYDSGSRQFQLNGFTIQVDNDTEFDDGLRESDLADGLLVKVEGEYRGGVIVAEEIEPREGEAELDGVIESLGGDGESLVVSGVQVFITASTLIGDDDLADDDDNIVRRTQDLETLNVGDYLEIEGIQTPDQGGGLSALKIEREDDDDDGFELEGRVTAVASDRITVLGLELLGTTSGISVGDHVEVDYSKTTGGEYVIEEIEVEDSNSDDDDSDDD
ncbi:hypothetical protein DET50_11411 [Marinobacter pelagius]|uniref:DUF5666 domain-containing protein n=1 Tax=Marinobacter pelagius TaxID=379482 RepID=A0A366GM75_9GAMM|nr:DUF5666 domain-containing protein [Marinobacter pelagius]RBP27526.1 hypothetical protein DET50_11411 [Marinobacter pelagius]